MRLLRDRNLSPRLVHARADVFPASTHVRDVGLSRATDDAVWTSAARHGYVIVSKGAKSHQRSFRFGHPPKVVRVRRGHCSPGAIETSLRQRHPDLLAFDADPERPFLARSCVAEGRGGGRPHERMCAPRRLCPRVGARGRELVRLAAVDPLNRVGIVTPGPRVPVQRRHAVVYHDGLPVPAGAALGRAPRAGRGAAAR